MNFDELKKDWEGESGGKVSEALLQHKIAGANNAIDKVRKNMRMDFYALIAMLLIAVVALVIVPGLVDIHAILYVIALSFFISGMILVVYFMAKFYRFYKKSYNLTFDAKDNLMWFYYELRYFIDFYYTFSLVNLVMGMACGMSFGFVGANLYAEQQEENVVSSVMEPLAGSEWLFIAAALLFVALGSVGLHFAVQQMYGKYLKQIKQTLDLFWE